MPNRIILKRSSVAAKVPLASDLSAGELAINLTDKRLFSEDASGNIINITVDATHVTSGTLPAARLPAFSGDATSTAGTSALTLANSGVTAGTYTKVTVDSKGRVTVGASLASADLPTYTGTITSSQVTTALGYTPYNATNPNGYITSSGSITGSAYQGFVQDTRSSVTGPSTGSRQVRWDFVGNSTDGLSDGGTYHGVMTFQQWSDASGGGTRQLGFTDNDNLWIRGSGTALTAYNSWKLLLNSSNYNSYAPTLTGTGASGTWGINITGSAASITGTYSGSLTSSQVTTALGFTPYNATNPNGYITSSGSISGNAGTATTLQTARTINGTSFNGSANIDTTEWVHSDRDFPNGTLITTNINYGVTNGDPWVLEIRGNSYGNIIPLDLLVQGYIYADTIINYGGISNGYPISGLVAINVSGNLCFWFPSQGYWNGYNVKVYSAYATRATNRVTSITGVAKPTSTKEVALSSSIRQALHSSNYTSYSPSLTGSGASGTWGISVTGSSASCTGNAATVTNGVYTTGAQSIAGLKTFTGGIRMQSSLGLDAGYALYFGYEEGFGGSDSGGNDYGYLIYDNNNSTYGSAGGETSTLRIGTQNDGDGAVGDHVAIEAAANIYLRPGAWGGGGSLRVGTLASYTTVVTSGNYNTYAPTLTGGGASGTWAISITGNAATAGGLSVHSGTNNEANKIVRTDGNGYIQAGWIYTASGDQGTSAIDRVYASYDGYIRYYSPTNFRTVLDVPTRGGSGASGTWGISISGNAATATSASQLGGISSNRAVLKRRTRIHSADSTSLNSSISAPEMGFTYGGSGEPTGPYIAFGGLNGDIDYSCQLAAAYSGGGNDFKIRTRNDDAGSWNSWRTILTDGNYSSYALPLTGGTVSGVTTFSSNTTFNASPTVNAYLNCSQWFNITGGAGYGLYGNGTNGAHFYLNSGSYGPWKILGSRNGWSGLEFGGLSNGDVTMMIGTASSTSGFYNTSYGWQFYWGGGTIWMSTASYGGGTLYAVLNSNNWGVYIGASSLGLGTGNNVTFNAVSDAIGNLRTIVQNAQSAAYTLVATDSGKHISITTGGVTVPSGVFSAGQAITIYNDSGSNQTITQGASVTMYLGGTATTGNRTLAQRGVVTVLCVASNTFVISGAGLT